MYTIGKKVLIRILLIFFMVFLPIPGAHAHFDGTNHMHPSSITVTLCPGECFEEDKQVDLEGAPVQGDVFFGFDCTASMTAILATAKLRSIDIMNDIRSLIPDTQFGVMSNRDYPEGWVSCGYSKPADAFPHYAYNLDHDLSSSLTDIETAINALTLNGGIDYPESYTRPLYESYADPVIRWRFKSKKILVYFLDDIPHDCDVYQCIGGPTVTTGIDPGRDAIPGTADDLPILDTLDTMRRHNITLLTVTSTAADFDIWDCYSRRTGGQAYLITDPSSLPTVVYNLVNEELSKITILELMMEPGYEDWLVEVDPAFYFNIDLDTPASRMFHIKICMPPGTAPGIYTFHLYAVGDGAVFAEQEITVRHCNLIAPTTIPTATPTPTGTWVPPTLTPTPVAHLDCSAAIDVPCGGGTYTGNTSTGISGVDRYSPCCTWLETGKENVYRVVTIGTGDLVAMLSDLVYDLDVFILDACDEYTCIAAGTTAAEARDLPPGIYYVVVDGYDSAEGGYTLNISSPCKSTVPANSPWSLFIITISILMIIMVFRLSICRVSSPRSPAH